MPQSDLFIRADTGEVVTHEYRASVVQLLKILYLLKIINQDQVVDVAAQFQSLFV